MTEIVDVTSRAMVFPGDCLMYLRNLQDASVDAVITDPPYGINFMGKHTPWDKVLPDPEIWRECFRVLKPGGFVAVFAFDRLYHRVATALDDAGFEIRHLAGWINSESMPKSRNIALDLEKIGNPRAEEFRGYGTGLRNSIEPIYVGRKPLDGTLANTALVHGTGGYGIDECRLPGDRWPPNIIFDEEEAAHIGKSSAYYLVPKVKKGERDAGLEGFEYVSPETITGRKAGSAGINNPRAGTRSGDRRNPHATVKPIALMEWLCRLLCPPEGLIVDPFAGSGSTGIGAVLAGRQFIGYELDEFTEMKYADGTQVSMTAIANARIKYWFETNGRGDRK